MENRVSFVDLLIELRPSLIHKSGVGVFAVVNMKKGQRVAEGISLEDFKHQIAWKDFASLDEKIKRKVMDFCVGTAKGFIPPEEMDFNKLSIEWYFNHSCEGNLGFNEAGDFIAIRNIRKDEELAYDYGLIESNPRFKMQCECVSKKCRKLITGNDWHFLLSDKVKSKYMHPFLKKHVST